MSLGRERGALAIVLHTHMPYVEGFGTWPFGEEWLWEAIAGSYVPLLELLDGGAPLTLSLTPVLCDQLEAPGLTERACRVAEVLDRLQQHDGIGRFAEALQQGALETQVARAVAQPRVLVGLRVGIDADHGGRDARQHGRPVALAAGHVQHPHAA